MRLKISSLIFSISLLCCNLFSQSLLKDINTTTRSTVFGKDMATLGNFAFFAADPEDGKGIGLWKTDGTPQGTARIKNALTGADILNPEDLWVAGNRLVFTALDTLRKVYTCNETGTDAAPIYKTGKAISAERFTASGGRVYFTSTDLENKTIIWSTDGTNAGTVQIASTLPFIGLRENIIAIGNVVYYLTESADYVAKLWRSDGTTQGTFALKTVNSRDGIVSIAAAGNTVFFWANTAPEGYALWKTDGSIAGTKLVKDLEPNAYGGFSLRWVSSDTHLFFIKDSGTGDRFWKTDGTEEGTVLLDANAPPISQLLIAGNTIYATGYVLWKSSFDGPFESITPPSMGVQNTGNLIFFNNNIYFTALNSQYGLEPWISDGTSGGTRLLKDVWEGTEGSSPRVAFILKNRLYWVAKDKLHGVELQVIGASGKTLDLAVDMNKKTNSSDMLLINTFGNTVILPADDGIQGIELWQYRTDNNLFISTDLHPGPNSSTPSGFIAWGEEVYYAARDSLYGNELRKINLKNNQTKLVSDLAAGPADSHPGYLTICNEKLFFTAGGIGTGVFSATDGTSAGTYPIEANIDPGPKGLICMQNKVYFSTNNTKLYKSDGTNGGTTVVKNFDLTQGLGYISGHTVFKGRLFFSAADAQHGQELWVSDGTADGTVLVKDIFEGPEDSKPEYLTVAGDYLYFLAINASYQSELWRTDGTPAGTTRVISLTPPATYWYIGGFCASGDLLYFLTQIPNGPKVKLWRSDGTLSGTFEVDEFKASIFSTGLFPWKNHIFFSGYDAENGTELWLTDGTKAGTKLVADICPGQCSSNPGLFASIDSTLFFSAYHPQYGREPWIFKAGTVPIPPIASSESFSVKVLRNPILDNELFVKVSTVAASKASFALYDPTGRRVWQESANLETGENKIWFSFPALPSEIYFFQTISNNKQFTTKIMVRR
jgi:ELWxxDGT repeat protein